jgi:hypothetical protein
MMPASEEVRIDGRSKQNLNLVITSVKKFVRHIPTASGD